MRFIRDLQIEITESFRIALLQIRSHKMRSILTALGVIIGIIAVTLMGSAISGIQIGFEGCQVHSVTRGCTNQARAAHMHFANGRGHFRHRPHLLDHELVRQVALVDELDHAFVTALGPNGPVMLALDVHESFYNWLLRITRDPQVVT